MLVIGCADWPPSSSIEHPTWTATVSFHTFTRIKNHNEPCLICTKNQDQTIKQYKNIRINNIKTLYIHQQYKKFHHIYIKRHKHQTQAWTTHSFSPWPWQHWPPPTVCSHTMSLETCQGGSSAMSLNISNGFLVGDRHWRRAISVCVVSASQLAGWR